MTDVTELGATTVPYAFADAAGHVFQIGKMPADMLAVQGAYAAPGTQVIAGEARLALDYILNGAITQRPANPTTLTGMKLLNVPNPATVTIAGVNPQAVTDGEVDLEFTQPGTYSVVVSAWPMLDATFSVTQP